MSKDTFHENVFLNRFSSRFVLSALNDPFTFPVRRYTVSAIRDDDRMKE
jgi:hypothetical protein